MDAHFLMELPQNTLPLRLHLPKPLTDKELQRFCERQEALHVERDPDGSLSVRSVWGLNAGALSVDIKLQLYEWAENTGRGVVLGNVGFFLPDGSMRGPLIAFVSNERWNAVDHNGFVPLCPEFVIEIQSLNYSRRELEDRVRMWMRHGTQLAWVFDPQSERVSIHRPDMDPVTRSGLDSLDGEGPIAGFHLDLSKAWPERQYKAYAMRMLERHLREYIQELPSRADGRKTITYGELKQRSGLNVPEVGLGTYLTPLGEQCEARDEPRLDALVVNKETGRPGGFWKEPEWSRVVEACYTQSSFGR